MNDATKTTLAITGTTKVRPTRLHSFNAARTEATFTQNGRDYIAKKTVRGAWKLTGEYAYRD